MKYIKKPVEIEAIQWNGNNFDDLKKFTNSSLRYRSYYDHNKYYEDKTTLVIKTLEGNMTVSNGDFIIKGVKGEFYPCKRDIFEMTYEKLD
jgi:hypothetical protein